MSDQPIPAQKTCLLCGSGFIPHKLHPHQAHCKGCVRKAATRKSYRKRLVIPPLIECQGQSVPEFPTREGVQFRSIPGFPGYCIGSDGTVWSCWRRAHRRVQPLGCKWRNLPGAPARDGHLKVRLSAMEEKWFSFFVHRLVLHVFIGSCPAGMQGCHNDGNPANNHLSNLRWDTPQSNAADSIRHGTFARGSRHARAKLTEEDVREIRRRLAAGHSQYAIAREYHVSGVRIHMIAHRKSWAWLDP